MNTKQLARCIRRVEKLFYNAKFDESLLLASKILQKNKNNTQLMILKGKLLQLSDKGNLAGALKMFKEVLELDNGNVEALIELAYFYYAVQNESRKSVKCFERAIELSEKNVETAYIGKAKAFIDLGEYRKAKVVLRKYLAINPKSRQARELLAECNT